MFVKKNGVFIPPPTYKNNSFFNSLFFKLISKNGAVKFCDNKNFSYLILENFPLSSRKFLFFLILSAKEFSEIIIFNSSISMSVNVFDIKFPSNSSNILSSIFSFITFVSMFDLFK